MVDSMGESWAAPRGERSVARWERPTVASTERSWAGLKAYQLAQCLAASKAWTKAAWMVSKMAAHLGDWWAGLTDGYWAVRMECKRAESTDFRKVAR